MPLLDEGITGRSLELLSDDVSGTTIRMTDLGSGGIDLFITNNSGVLSIFVNTGAENSITLSEIIRFEGGNIKFKSGQSDLGEINHSITSARTWTFPDITGRVMLSVATIITASITLGNQVNVFVDNTTAITITLPPATVSRVYRIIKRSAPGGPRVITIDTTGADTINGLATMTLSAKFEGKILASDGVSDWGVFS